VLRCPCALNQRVTTSILYTHVHTADTLNAVSSSLVLLRTTARFSAFRATFFRGLARSAVAGPLPVLALGLLASALYRAHDTAAAQQQQQEWSSERLIACAVLAAVAVLLGLYLPSLLRIQRQIARARRRRQQQQQRLRQRQHQQQQRTEQQQQQQQQQQQHSSGSAHHTTARSGASFREAFAAALRQDSTSRNKQQQQLKTWPSSAATAGALQQLQIGSKATSTTAGAAAGATNTAAVPSGWEAFDRARRLDAGSSLHKQQQQRAGTQAASTTAASITRSGTAAAAAATAARQQWQPQMLPSLSEVLYSTVAVALLVLCGEGVSSDRRGSGRLLGPAAAAAAVVLALPLSQVSLDSLVL
jgi:hypothetical protein